MSQDCSFVIISDEDHDIIRRVLNDSVNTYSLLIEKYQTPVYNLFLRMLHDRNEAEELTQVVFVKAYEALPLFRFEYRFFSWLYRIAVNQALAQLGKRRKFVEIEYIHNLPDDLNENTSYHDQKLSVAVDQLKSCYKAVVVLKYYQQLSYKEIAFALDIPEKKVRSRLYDARLQLKLILDKTGFYS